MSLFVVPWTALFAEFTDDYVERTTIVTWRYIVGWVMPTAFTFATYSLIFPNTRAHPRRSAQPRRLRPFRPDRSPGDGRRHPRSPPSSRGARFPTCCSRRSATPRFSLAAGLARHRLHRRQPRLPDPVFGRAIVRGRRRHDRHARHLHVDLLLGTDPEQLQWFSLAIIGAVAAFALAGLRRPAVRQAHRAADQLRPDRRSSAWA